jgi:hypothetical protein
MQITETIIFLLFICSNVNNLAYVESAKRISLMVQPQLTAESFFSDHFVSI